MADQQRSSRRGLDYEPNETPSRMASVDDFLDSVDDALLLAPVSQHARGAQPHVVRTLRDFNRMPPPAPAREVKREMETAQVEREEKLQGMMMQEQLDLFGEMARRIQGMARMVSGKREANEARERFERVVEEAKAALRMSLRKSIMSLRPILSPADRSMPECPKVSTEGRFPSSSWSSGSCPGSTPGPARI